MSELTRANKLTAYWEGEGVAVGTFYRTHNKLLAIRSNDDSVVNAGFQMPQSTEGNEVGPQDKLEAFKQFLQSNASVFGMIYDPVDRRPDEFKFPNKYDEASFTEYSKIMLGNVLADVAKSVQANVIDKMIAAGHIVEGSELSYDIGEAQLGVTETYKTGSIKYGSALYPVTLGVNGLSTTVEVTIDVVSGQLKKPRQFGEEVFTMTGVKNTLVTAGVLPKIEKPSKEESDTDTDTDFDETNA